MARNLTIDASTATVAVLGAVALWQYFSVKNQLAETWGYFFPSKEERLRREAAKRQADIVYAKTHTSAEDDIRNTVNFGGVEDPNVLIKEAIKQDVQTESGAILESVKGQNVVVTDEPIDANSVVDKVVVSTAQNAAVLAQKATEDAAVEGEQRLRFVDTVLTGDDATYWKDHVSDFCATHTGDEEIWVGNFLNRHKLGSKVGFNNYTGSESVTCDEYRLWRDRY